MAPDLLDLIVEVMRILDFAIDMFPSQHKFCLVKKSLKLKLNDFIENLNFWKERSSSIPSHEAVMATGP